MNVLRFFSPRLAARLELWLEQRATRPDAYKDAHVIAEVFGLTAMAAELECEAQPHVVAQVYADGFHPVCRREVFRGVIDGLEAYREKQQ